MPVKYACFISYRHSRVSDRSLLKRVTDYLYRSLRSEIEALNTKGVAIDVDRLKGGDFYNKQIANDLCQSACMIVVYVPTYFDRDHTYCAREYRAMERLEEERLKLLDPVLRKHGLIIPIVFRGFDHVPDEIKRNRLCYNFSEFDEYESHRETHRRFGKFIREIAAYVVKCAETLDEVAEDVCIECDEFALPSEAQIRSWLGKMISARAPFPWRAG